MHEWTTTHDKVRWAVSGAMYSMMRESNPEWDWTESAEADCREVTKVIWENYRYSQTVTWKWTEQDSKEVKSLALDIFQLNGLEDAQASYCAPGGGCQVCNG